MNGCLELMRDFFAICITDPPLYELRHDKSAQNFVCVMIWWPAHSSLEAIVTDLQNILLVHDSKATAKNSHYYQWEFCHYVQHMPQHSAEGFKNNNNGRRRYLNKIFLADSTLKWLTFLASILKVQKVMGHKAETWVNTVPPIQEGKWVYYHKLGQSGINWHLSGVTLKLHECIYYIQLHDAQTPFGQIALILLGNETWLTSELNYYAQHLLSLHITIRWYCKRPTSTSRLCVQSSEKNTQRTTKPSRLFWWHGGGSVASILRQSFRKVAIWDGAQWSE